MQFGVEQDKVWIEVGKEDNFTHLMLDSCNCLSVCPLGLSLRYSQTMAHLQQPLYPLLQVLSLLLDESYS